MMSIVGYVMGLGDRHPDSLYIHTLTGAVLHSNFSELFDVSNFPFLAEYFFCLQMDIQGGGNSTDFS